MLGFVLLQTRPCMPSRPAGGQGHRALPWASFTLEVPLGTGTREPFDVTLKVGPTSSSVTEPHAVLWRCLTSHSLCPQRARRLTAKSMLLGASRGPCLRADRVAQAPHPGKRSHPGLQPNLLFLLCSLSQLRAGLCSARKVTGFRKQEKNRMFYVPVP